MRLRSRLCACSAALALTVPGAALPALAETEPPETPAAGSTSTTPAEPESTPSEPDSGTAESDPTDVATAEDAKESTAPEPDGEENAPGEGDPTDDGDPTDATAREMPGLIGLPEAEAISQLEELDLDLRWNVVREAPADSDVAVGTVFRTDPAAEDMVEPGSTITIVVATEAEAVPVVIPRVAGELEADAWTIIRDLGLDVTVVREASSEVEPGRVIRTEPGEDSEVALESTVVLVVSSGPETVEVPGVVRKTKSDAATTLEDAGLTVEFDEAPSESVDAGLVISTDPDEGSSVDRGTEVTVLVSTGNGSSTEQPVEPETPTEPTDPETPTDGSEEPSDGGGEDNTDGGEAEFTDPEGPTTPTPSPEPSEPGTSGGREQDRAPVEPSPEPRPTVQSSDPEPQQIPEATAPAEPADPADPPVEEPAEAETLPVADAEEPESPASEEPESPAEEESPTEEPTTPAPAPMTPSAGGTGSGESGPVDQFLNAMSDESGGFGRLRPVFIAVIGLGFLTAAGFIGATLRGRQSGGPGSSSI